MMYKILFIVLSLPLLTAVARAELGENPPSCVKELITKNPLLAAPVTYCRIRSSDWRGCETPIGNAIGYTFGRRCLSFDLRKYDRESNEQLLARCEEYYQRFQREQNVFCPLSSGINQDNGGNGERPTRQNAPRPRANPGRAREG